MDEKIYMIGKVKIEYFKRKRNIKEKKRKWFQIKGEIRKMILGIVVKRGFISYNLVYVYLLIYFI